MTYIRYGIELFVAVVLLAAAQIALASTDHKAVRVCIANAVVFAGIGESVTASARTDVKQPAGKAALQRRGFSRYKKKEFKTLQKRARKLNLLQRSSNPRDRKKAKALYPALAQDMKRFARKYKLNTSRLTWSVKKGRYPKDDPDENCIRVIEGKKVICILDERASTDTECVYDCYEKKDEPVGAY